MKGTRYVDGVLVSQEQVNTTDQAKSSSIKERMGTLISYGVVDSGNKFGLTNNSNTTLTILSGEGYCDFDPTSGSPEYGNTGERIYLGSSLTSLAVKSSPITSGNPRHVFLVYVELHSNIKLDENNVSHYTTKEDSFVITQLTDSELSSLTTIGSVYVSDNPIHTDQTDLTGLTTAELNDTFGEDRWSRPGDLFADVTVTQYNSLYIGTASYDGQSATSTGTTVKPILQIATDVINVAELEQEIQSAHRIEQHSDGIIGGSNALLTVIDSTAIDELSITDLSTNEYAFINGNKLESNTILPGYLTISITDISATGEYYLYLYRDTADGTFKTDVQLTSNSTYYTDPDYMILGSIYVDKTGPNIKAYQNDNRYDSASATNPITDLRIFGTIDTNTISDGSISNLVGANLLPNGEFEEGTIGDTPTGWFGDGILNVGNTLGGKYSTTLAAAEVLISSPIPYNKESVYRLFSSIKGAGTTGTYALGLRGYVSKDWSDSSFDNDATNPINLSYTEPVSGGIKTTTWATSGDFNTISSDWQWTTPDGGSYTSADLDKVKYIRFFVKNISGSDIYIDNLKLIDTNGTTAAASDLNTLTAGASADADALHTHPNISIGSVTGGDTHDHSGGDGAPLSQGFLVPVQVGDLLLYHDPEEGTGTSGPTMVKSMEMYIPRAGDYRVTVTLTTPLINDSVGGQLWKNGVYVLTLGNSGDSTLSITFEVDTTGWVIGDLLQIYINGEGSSTVHAENLRLSVRAEDLI